MTVYLDTGCVTWSYDFRFRGMRHRGSTHQTRKEDAELVEAKLKLRLRQQLGGIASLEPADTPRFHDWAEIYLTYQSQFVTRPDVLERTVQVLLEFWGARPLTPRKAPAAPRSGPVVEAPYHDLRLGDPIADPNWILTFQTWMDARGIGGSTRNSYLSALSGMYKTALQPEYRLRARIDTNPFRDIRRAAPVGRIVALEPSQVVAWIQEASYHVALAVTIGALAPKLRLQSILDLEWSHFDRDLTRLTVIRHKTASRSGTPQVTPISDQLREVLLDARERAKGSKSRHVVTYRGTAVQSIKTGARRAAEAVGLTWGMPDGVTFHVIRHSIATLLAEMGMPEAMRKELMGHTEIRTTQKYTHLAAKAQMQPHEDLSAQLPLKDLLLAKPRPHHGENPGKRKPTVLNFLSKTGTSDSRE